MTKAQQAQLIAAYQKPACDGATMDKALNALKSIRRRNPAGYADAVLIHRIYANPIRTVNGRKAI